MSAMLAEVPNQAGSVSIPSNAESTLSHIGAATSAAHGTVELLDVMGDDLTVVNAARVSFNRTAQEFREADAKLVEFLARERHGSPFEHVVFQFRVSCPIFVAREWFRHRIGSFNEMSGRYVEIPAKYYLPEPGAVRSQYGKPGQYTFEEMAHPQVIMDAIEEASTEAIRAYHRLLERGVAKELARSVLPQGMFTQFIWTVNLRSLTNFLSLRTAPNALLEIREMADQVEAFVRDTTPVCHAAWANGGRQPL
jgi:thymidylate synthase (FAD)